LTWDAGDAPDIDKLGCTCHSHSPDTYTFRPKSHDTLHTMSASYFQERATPASQNGFSPASPSAVPASRGTNALSNRITSVLSASYADLEIRDALETLDSRGIQNTAETRRQLRLDVQKDVIQCNGEIVKDFGEVAEVRWNIDITMPGLIFSSN
jgi:hypothetical protein